MNEGLGFLEGLMTSHMWAAPLLCLFAGVVTSFTPCSLAGLPLLLSSVKDAGGDRRKVFLISLAMAGGMALTFGFFGSVASAVGQWMHHAGDWWTVLMGVLMILMALQIFDVIHLIPHVHLPEKIRGKDGYLGAFISGALSGLFASHCAVPVMVALLALVADMGWSMAWGVLLMVLYALGHSVLLILSGVGYGYAWNLSADSKLGSWGKVLRNVLGVLVMVLGILMIFGEK